jgi:hypothetical protein
LELATKAVQNDKAVVGLVEILNLASQPREIAVRHMTGILGTFVRVSGIACLKSEHRDALFAAFCLNMRSLRGALFNLDR